jgi:hypothetical protein
VNDPVIWHLYHYSAYSSRGTACGSRQPSEIKFPGTDYVDCPECIKRRKIERLQVINRAARWQKDLERWIEDNTTP